WARGGLHELSRRGFVCKVRVRELLEEAILEGELKPGERLRAEALAQRFGTSRTPVREALLQLEGQGLIEPHAAARAATRISEAQIAELAALCAAEDQLVANEVFHRIILEAAQSP